MASTSEKADLRPPHVVAALLHLYGAVFRGGVSNRRVVYVVTPAMFRDYEEYIQARDGRAFDNDEFARRWPGHLLFKGRPVVACQYLPPDSSFVFDENAIVEHSA